MTQVNPVPFPKIPSEWLNNAEKRAWAEQLQTIAFQLRERSGGDNDTVQDLLDINDSSFNAQVQQLQKELDGLPEFTIDTTGFTTDTTLITTDKVIA